MKKSIYYTKWHYHPNSKKLVRESLAYGTRKENVRHRITITLNSDGTATRAVRRSDEHLHKECLRPPKWTEISYKESAKDDTLENIRRAATADLENWLYAGYRYMEDMETIPKPQTEEAA